MSEIENRNIPLKSQSKHSDQPYSTDICNEDDHDWWASDSGSSTGSYYSDTDSSVVEWEAEIRPNGEVFYIESAEESLLEDPTTLDKSNSPQPDLTRRRSTRAGKLLRLIRRKESKRWSTRNKRINNSIIGNTLVQEKGDGSGNKEVTFRDFQAGEMREVTLWVDPERRHKLGRRATLCEAYFGITPGVFSDKVRVMVAGFIPDGEAVLDKMLYFSGKPIFVGSSFHTDYAQISDR